MAKSIVTTSEPITDQEMEKIVENAGDQSPVRPAMMGPDPLKAKTEDDSEPTTYETDIHLPSRGLVYKDIPETIRIRAMTTEDEKILFASNSGNIMRRVLSRCIVYPKNLNVEELISADEQFIMIKLREFTYGSDYHIKAKCSKCGAEHEYKINLSSFESKELPDDFEEPLKMILPMCKKELEVRMLRNKDYVNIHDAAVKRARKSVKSNVNELEYILRMIAYIKSVNGVDSRDMNIQSFVENLHARDSAYFWAFINTKFDCGLDTTTILDCLSCGESIDIDFEINSEFFRPKFEF